MLVAKPSDEKSITIAESNISSNEVTLIAEGNQESSQDMPESTTSSSLIHSINEKVTLGSAESLMPNSSNGPNSQENIPLNLKKASRNSSVDKMSKSCDVTPLVESASSSSTRVKYIASKFEAVANVEETSTRPRTIPKTVSSSSLPQVSVPYTSQPAPFSYVNPQYLLKAHTTSSVEFASALEEFHQEQKLKEDVGVSNSKSNSPEAKKETGENTRKSGLSWLKTLLPSNKNKNKKNGASQVLPTMAEEKPVADNVELKKTTPSPRRRVSLEEKLLPRIFDVSAEISPTPEVDQRKSPELVHHQLARPAVPTHRRRKKQNRYDTAMI